MAMTVIWTGMTVGALFFSLALGNQAELAPAALDGASSAVQLGISMAGVLCLWMGVMEVMQRSGLAEKLARLLKPVLGRLFPDFASDKGTMDTLAANVSANLLGLGNAATPLGLETARRMSRRTPGVAESLALGAMLLDGGHASRVICAASSHFCTAERQYRFPLEFGSQRPPTAQWTVTGVGAALLDASPQNTPLAHICQVCPGRVVDLGICDANNMGAAMAPEGVNLDPGGVAA